MTEAQRSLERSKHERCPFCHDAFDATDESADARVSCALCGAPHHAQCFVENRRCSVMGCGSLEVLVAGREGSLPVGVLEAEVASETLATPSPPRGSSLGGALLILLLFAGGVGLASLRMYTGAALAILLACAIAFLWFLFRFSPELPEARIEDQGEPLAPVENPTVNHAIGKLWGADPFEAVRDEIKREQAAERADAAKTGAKAPEAAPPSAPPATLSACPVCKKSLEREPDDDGPAAFCFHCGAALT